MRNWDKIYKNNLHLSTWPWTDIVTLVNRYTDYKIRKKLNIVEIGSGLGANINFLKKNNNNYFGNEESIIAYKFLKKNYNRINIKKSNFLDCKYKDNFFDIVIDRASITHNSYNDIIKIIDKSYKILKPDGKFISTYLFSKNCSILKGYKKDTNTFKNIKNGFLSGVGTVSFFNKNNILELFTNKFNIIHLEHNKKNILQPSLETISWWNIVGQKNGL